MVLPDRLILKLGESLLDPFRRENVQPASIDLCLGNEFIVYDSHRQRYVDLDDPADASSKKVTVNEDGDGFTLQPKEFVLGVTEETVMLPSDIMARLEGKSSIGRLGVMVHVTAGFIDPGFHGPITLEICNLRQIPVVLRPGISFCQLSFHRLEAPAAKPYQGRYQNAKGVEPSKLGGKLGGKLGPLARAFEEGLREGGIDDPPPLGSQLSPRHPAMGMLSQEEFEESGYDGPMVPRDRPPLQTFHDKGKESR